MDVPLLKAKPVILVFIEQNCTFNLEVLGLCVSVVSGHLPTGTTWRTLAVYGVH